MKNTAVCKLFDCIYCHGTGIDPENLTTPYDIPCPACDWVMDSLPDFNQYGFHISSGLWVFLKTGEIRKEPYQGWGLFGDDLKFKCEVIAWKICKKI